MENPTQAIVFKKQESYHCFLGSASRHFYWPGNKECVTVVIVAPPYKKTSELTAYQVSDGDQLPKDDDFFRKLQEKGVTVFVIGGTRSPPLIENVIKQLIGDIRDHQEAKKDFINRFDNVDRPYLVWHGPKRKMLLESQLPIGTNWKDSNSKIVELKIAQTREWFDLIGKTAKIETQKKLLLKDVRSPVSDGPSPINETDSPKKSKNSGMQRKEKPDQKKPVEARKTGDGITIRSKEKKISVTPVAGKADIKKPYETLNKNSAEYRRKPKIKSFQKSKPDAFAESSSQESPIVTTKTDQSPLASTVHNFTIASSDENSRRTSESDSLDDRWGGRWDYHWLYDLPAWCLSIVDVRDTDDVKDELQRKAKVTFTLSENLASFLIIDHSTMLAATLIVDFDRLDVDIFNSMFQKCISVILEHRERFGTKTLGSDKITFATFRNGNKNLGEQFRRLVLGKKTKNNAVFQ